MQLPRQVRDLLTRQIHFVRQIPGVRAIFGIDVLIAFGAPFRPPTPLPLPPDAEPAAGGGDPQLSPIGFSLGCVEIGPRGFAALDFVAAPITSAPENYCCDAEKQRKLGEGPEESLTEILHG